MNKSIIIIFLVSLLLSSIGALLGAGEGLKKESPDGYSSVNHLYPNGGKALSDSWVYWFFYTGGSWVLLFTNFVPISMMVSMEMVKFWQAMFMANEKMMYDDE